jgi:FkbM family methyltransferase
VGLFSETFLDLGAKVIAVEPIDENFKHLNERLRGHQNFHAVQAAVSAVSGASKIHKTNLLDLSTLDESFVKFNEEQFHTKWKDTQPVSLITLDQLIKKYDLPDFCKIDVECHEKEVLSGLTNRIPVISFEYLFPFKNKALDCIERISELSPNTVYNYSLYEFFELENEEWLDKASFVIHLKQLSQKYWTGDIFCKLS